MLPMTHFFLYSNIFHGYKWDFPYDSRLEMGDILPESWNWLETLPKGGGLRRNLGCPFDAGRTQWRENVAQGARQVLTGTQVGRGKSTEQCCSKK